MKQRMVLSIAAGLSLGFAGTAIAHGGNANLVHVCKYPSSGATRIVGPNQSCASGEYAKHWAIPRPAGSAGPKNNTGATGATGPQGSAGLNGAPGTDGAPGQQGPAGANGGSGPAGSQGDIGPQGPVGPPGLDGAPGWDPLYATVGAGSDLYSNGITQNNIELRLLYNDPNRPFYCFHDLPPIIGGQVTLGGLPFEGSDNPAVHLSTQPFSDCQATVTIGYPQNQFAQRVFHVLLYVAP